MSTTQSSCQRARSGWELPNPTSPKTEKHHLFSSMLFLSPWIAWRFVCSACLLIWQPCYTHHLMQVSNTDFARFVEETSYITDAERFGWSFVHRDMLSATTKASVPAAAAQVPWWLPVFVHVGHMHAIVFNDSNPHICLHVASGMLQRRCAMEPP